MYFVDLKKYLLLCMYGHLKIGLCTSSGTLSFCLKWNWEVELSWSDLYSKCFYLEPSHWPDFMDFFLLFIVEYVFVPALRRQRCADLDEFEVSLFYMMS